MMFFFVTHAQRFSHWRQNVLPVINLLVDLHVTERRISPCRQRCVRVMVNERAHTHAHGHMANSISAMSPYVTAMKTCRGFGERVQWPRFLRQSADAAVATGRDL